MTAGTGLDPRGSQQSTVLGKKDLPRTRQSTNAIARTYGLSAGAGAAGEAFAVSLCGFIFSLCSFSLPFMASSARTAHG